MKRVLSAVLYGCGALITAVLVLLILSRSSIVLHPEAMLPMQLHELAVTWLALGALPMLGAYWFFRRTWGLRGWKAALVFLPAAVCGAALLFLLGIWVIGLLRCPPE